MRFISLSTLFTVADALFGDRRHCRCTSDLDRHCWPTESDFQLLSSQVSQPLVYPIPPASPCYPISDPSGNCSDIQARWYNGTWRVNIPGAMQATQYETYTYHNGTISGCFLDTTLGFPCEQGNLPTVGVDARSPEDIQAAVKFASQHNLRVVIKNTGHDLLGRSIAKGSFLIWTHHMKNITFQSMFTPVGADSSVVYDNVFTFESGVQWVEAYAAAVVQNRVLVGGGSPGGTVGSAGGWVLGGGHSIVSAKYGLGVDNVVQMSIVIADGSHLTANAHKNADLFWALRGGGGGTYGVLTSVTYRSHPPTPFIGAFFTANRTESNYTNPNAVQNILTELVRLTPQLVDHGYGGFGVPAPSSISFSFFASNVTLAQANETYQPFFDYALSQAESGGLTIQSFLVPYPSFDSWYEQLFGSGSMVVGGYGELTSRLLPKDVVKGDPEHVSQILMELPSTVYSLCAGGAVSRVDPDSTGLNPAWRKPVVHVLASRSWDERTPPEEVDALRADFKVSMAKLDGLAPDSGAYFNEASRHEFNWKKSFFGAHYDKLKAIKDMYDPDGLFIVWKGVGSDDWDASLNCRVHAKPST